MMRSLLLILLFVTAVSAIETFMMRRYNPFQSPLGYNGLSVTGGADKKMISNRRKANKIVDANMEKAKAKEISVRKKTKKQWGVAKNEKGGEFSFGRGLYCVCQGNKSQLSVLICQLTEFPFPPCHFLPFMP